MDKKLLNGKAVDLMFLYEDYKTVPMDNNILYHIGFETIDKDSIQKHLWIIVYDEDKIIFVPFFKSRFDKIIKNGICLFYFLEKAKGIDINKIKAFLELITVINHGVVLKSEIIIYDISRFNLKKALKKI